MNTQDRVTAKIAAYNKLQCYGADEAAKQLDISVGELMNRVRGAQWYQAMDINFHIK